MNAYDITISLLMFMVAIQAIERMRYDAHYHPKKFWGDLKILAALLLIFGIEISVLILLLQQADFFTNNSKQLIALFLIITSVLSPFLLVLWDKRHRKL
ncbi:MAG: hypothetical protein KGI50_04310 [Patescibacteria group bacterium]|nr:hypothetical protein [Patescibacteria group bacterium]MDE2438491.1 hypothetical protein [Patescibacteria group bacterium]